MNDEQQNFEFLDLIIITSFIIQLQNQGHILSLKDIHYDTDKIIDKIQSHLQEQDTKIDKIIKMLST